MKVNFATAELERVYLGDVFPLLCKTSYKNPNASTDGNELEPVTLALCFDDITRVNELKREIADAAGRSLRQDNEDDEEQE